MSTLYFKISSIILLLRNDSAKKQYDFFNMLCSNIETLTGINAKKVFNTA